MTQPAEMPESRKGGLPIALDKAVNRIVRYQVAANRSEADEVMTRLSFIVSDGLQAELEVSDEAHRYDLDAKRAYSFLRESDRLHVWTWEEVDSYVEAGNLLSLVASLVQDLTEELACGVYERATGRSVNEPRVFGRENLADD